MADARALLRRQREARRITHPHATYTDAGKLSCAVCRQPIRAESLWSAHIRGEAHRTQLQTLHPHPSPPPPPASKRKYDQSIHESGSGNTTKVAMRKNPRQQLEEVEEDPERRDSAPAQENGAPKEEQDRRKRSRHDDSAPFLHRPLIADSQNSDGRESHNADPPPTTPTPPPSQRARSTSGTPLVGVEICIPSRPATPATTGLESSATSTPVAGSGVPIIAVTADTPPSLTSKSSAPHAAVLGSSYLPVLTSTAGTGPRVAGGHWSSSSSSSTSWAAAVDEDEWSAFQAEITAVSAPYDDHAVISAAAMTLEESAAAVAAGATNSDPNTRNRKTIADLELLAEKEEASRALELEFDDMEALEVRVRRLKEKREALRVAAAGLARIAVGGSAERGNVEVSPALSGVMGRPEKESEKSEEEVDDDEDDEDDDWGHFGFQTGKPPHR